eukprot:Skav202106  [mRNA]  locus=scaffold1980:78609:79907:+ [translate_table: standard]
MPLVKPPADVPDPFKDSVDKLSQNVKTLLISKEIPWRVMGKLADDGYVTLDDLADRWDTAAAARTNSPRDLDFVNGTHGVPQAEEQFIAMRIFQCVRHAKAFVTINPTSTTGIVPGPALTSSSSSGMDVACDRKQLLKDWDVKVKQVRPRLHLQGSDTYLKHQYKFCSKGEIGWFPITHIISALPDMDERPLKTRRKISLNGWDREEEEEERRNPSTRDQLQRAHQVFRNTLLMCMTAFPQFAVFDASYEDLELWYAWFWGKDIAERKPPPSEQVLMYAERNAWREIHNKVFEGKHLKAAMEEMKQDTLCWTREVYERLQSKSEKGSPAKTTKGRGKQQGGKSPSWTPQQTQWQKPRQDKGSKGKSKGQSKSKSPSWPSNWARTTPKGMQFCRDHLLHGKCPGNCGRSHGCSVLKDGWICNGNHHPDQCPNK